MPYVSNIPPAIDSQASFHSLIEQLLHHMRIELPPEKRNQVYSLKFGNRTQVHLFCSRSDALDLVAEIGTLANTRADTVLPALLALNRFDAHGLPLSVGMAPGTGLVSIWVRQSLAELDLDKIIGLLEHVLGGAAAAHRILTPDAELPRHARPLLTTASFLRARNKFSKD